MSPKVILILTAIIAMYSLQLSAQNTESVDFNQSKPDCGGQISDINCYREIIKESALSTEKTNNQVMTEKISGVKIIVDTHDDIACSQVKEYIIQKSAKSSKESINLDELCNHNQSTSQERYKEITFMWEVEQTYRTRLKNPLSNENILKSHTRNLSLMMVGTMGLLWVLPESISKWDKDEIRSAGFMNKYKQNTGGRPVLDSDDPIVNYVGHPISGAIYYNIARNAGYSAMQSFGYSVVMSTFFWEYGFEAVAEKPSIQDLIITPIVGSLMGEVFYEWSEKIKANNGVLWGSPRAGKAVLFLLSPADAISNKINEYLEHRVIQDAETNLVISRTKDPLTGSSRSYIGLEMVFKF